MLEQETVKEEEEKKEASCGFETNGGRFLLV